MLDLQVGLSLVSTVTLFLKQKILLYRVALVLHVNVGTANQNVRSSHALVLAFHPGMDVVVSVIVTKLQWASCGPVETTYKLLSLEGM